jgi:hypothetical protein
VPVPWPNGPRGWGGVLCRTTTSSSRAVGCSSRGNDGADPVELRTVWFRR